MSRWQASSIHLGISLLIVITLGILLSLTWYPPQYAQAAGGLGLITILAGVDTCLGPLLTLVVWNIKKASLKLDLAVIVLLQLAGLGYGLHAIFLARPVYVVFATDRFELKSAVDIPESELGKADREEFKSLPLTGPRLVSVKPPNDSTERMRILSSALGGGADVSALPQYYLPYAEAAAGAANRGMPLARLMERNEDIRKRIAAYIESAKLDPSRLKYLPLQAKKRSQTMLIDSMTGEIRGIMDIDPW